MEDQQLTQSNMIIKQYKTDKSNIQIALEQVLHDERFSSNLMIWEIKMYQNALENSRAIGIQNQTLNDKIMDPKLYALKMRKRYVEKLIKKNYNNIEVFVESLLIG